MIVTSIGTHLDRYYGVDKKLVIKNVYNPVTEKMGVEYIQYIYNKIGQLEPTKSVGVNLDKHA